MQDLRLQTHFGGAGGLSLSICLSADHLGYHFLQSAEPGTTALSALHFLNLYAKVSLPLMYLTLLPCFLGYTFLPFVIISMGFQVEWRQTFPPSSYCLLIIENLDKENLKSRKIILLAEEPFLLWY